MELRGYQTHAVTELRSWLAAHERELLLESPVGSGKTTITQALSAAELASGALRLVVVLVPQNLLKDGWAKAPKVNLPTALPEARVIHEVAELTADFWRTARGFVVVSRQALTSKRGLAVLAGLDAGDIADVFVVADEGHHCADMNASGRMLATLRSKGAATLLVSATPWATAGAVGENARAHRLPEAAYVCAFQPGDVFAPPREFVIDRVFVGKAVADAEATIDRSGTRSRKVTAEAGEDMHARRMTAAMVQRWADDGFPRAVFNVPRQTWAEPLARALRKVNKGADLLDLVGVMKPDALAAAQDRIRADSDAKRWADVRISAIMSCARMDEGTDWVPCSHVYNAGIPAVPGLILQRWGRAARPKRRIEGYPAQWVDARTLVFFTPPGTGEGDSWKAQTETAWLLAGFVGDYAAALAWTEERVARGEPAPAALPVPATSPAVMEWTGRLCEQIERVGGTMEPVAARAWLTKQGAPAEVADAVVRRQQMQDPAHREAEEKRAAGLRVKSDRRPEAEPLIEEFATLLRSAGASATMARFTALDAKTHAERMSATGSPWGGMTIEQLRRYRDASVARWTERHGRRPTLHSPPCPELGGLSWSALNAAFLRHRESMFGRVKATGVPIEVTAERVAAFIQEHGREPVAGRVTMAEATPEQRLGHGLRFMRNKRPDLCDRHDIARQASRGENIARGRQQRAEMEYEAIRVLFSSEAVVGDPDLCQAKTAGLVVAEVRADCWALWLDGATDPDPRPWAEILASGDHKRVVKAERVAFLDWEKPGKDGKPVRRPWTFPAVALAA